MADENNTELNTENTPAEKKRCNRKTSHKIMLAGGLAVVVGIAAFAGAAHSSGWGEHGYGEHGYGGHGRQGHMMQMFDTFDADGDRRLTRAEMHDARTARFNGADSNNDKALSLEEFQGLWLEFLRPRMVDKFQMLDENGDAKVTEKEFARPFDMALRYMDRNDDGVLEMREMKHKRHWYHDDDDYYDDDDRYERRYGDDDDRYEYRNRNDDDRYDDRDDD